MLGFSPSQFKKSALKFASRLYGLEKGCLYDLPARKTGSGQWNWRRPVNSSLTARERPERHQKGQSL